VLLVSRYFGKHGHGSAESGLHPFSAWLQHKALLRDCEVMSRKLKVKTPSLGEDHPKTCRAATNKRS